MKKIIAYLIILIVLFNALLIFNTITVSASELKAPSYTLPGSGKKQ
jgi:hypothetical protein